MSIDLETMLDYEPIDITDCSTPFDGLYNRIENDKRGRMCAYLNNGAKVVFADYRLPDDRLCLSVKQIHLIPSSVILFLSKNQPTEDVEVWFVGGTIVRKKIKEAE